MIPIIGGLWIICGVLTYLFARAEMRRLFGGWTVGCRVMGIVFSLFGPLGLAAISMSALVTWVLSFDREVKW